MFDSTSSDLSTEIGLGNTGLIAPDRPNLTPFPGMQTDYGMALSPSLTGIGAIAQAYDWASSTAIEVALSNLHAQSDALGATLGENTTGLLTPDLGWELAALCPDHTPEPSDDSLATARDLGLLNGSQSLQDRIGTGADGVQDANDYYRFEVSSFSQVSLGLNCLTAAADLELFDANGNLLRTSLAAGSQSEWINAGLDAGTYYVRVYPFLDSATDYILTLDALADGAGNSLSEARELGLLGETQSFFDFVGTGDSTDFYRFTVKEDRNFDLSLTGLSEDIDVQLLDANGNVLGFSEAPGTNSESLAGILTAGTYFVQVYPFLSASSEYTLQLSAGAIAPTPPLPSGYSRDSGYGLVDASAALANVLGQDEGEAVADLGGNYWGLDLLQVPEVWAQGYTGEGVVVAVIDTGMDYRHADLNDNIWQNLDEISGNGLDDDGNGYVDDILGWDFLDNDADPSFGFDFQSFSFQDHATHVAGIIAAESGGLAPLGVAYNAQIMPLRLLNDQGFSSENYPEQMASAIYYAVNNGADIINLSLGGYATDPLIGAAIRYADDQGVFLVYAAGNEGEFGVTGPSFPARYATDYGIAVGAVGDQGQQTDYSNPAGSNPQMNYVLAPGGDLDFFGFGRGVYSTLPLNEAGERFGTSMAAPYVAGVAALLLEANPDLTPDQLRLALTETAIALT